MASRTARGVGATPASFNFLADRWGLQPLARQRHDLPEGECIHAGKRPLRGFDHCDGRALRGLELRQSSSQTNILGNLKRISNSCFAFSARSPWEKEHPRAKCNFPFLGIDFGFGFAPSPLNNVDGVLGLRFVFGPLRFNIVKGGA